MNGGRAEGSPPLEGWVVGGCPELVERTAHLDFMDRIATRAAAGEAQLAVVTGEAGTGKSRLTREFTASLTSPWRTLYVRIDAGATNPFGDLVGTVPAGEAPAGAIGFALGRALAERAGDVPLAVVIEDLELADPVVIAALAATLDQLHDERVLLLATFRLGGHPQQRNAAGALASVLRVPSAHEVRLESLSRDGVAQMAAAMGRQLSEGDVDTLHARGSGNPFFVEELLLSHSDQLPWTITEAVLQRFDALSPAANEVARVLACAREPVSRSVVEDIVEDGGPGISALLASGIAVTGAADGIALRHALIGEVIEAQLPAERRHDLHRVLAEVLEQHDDTPAARLTRHWSAAGDAARAAQWAAVAADEATRGRSYRTAADLYRIAVTHPPGGALEQAELFDRAAVAAGWVGLDREAFEWASRADEHYREAGEAWRASAMWLNPSLRHAPKPSIDHQALGDDAVPRLLTEAREASRRREFAAAAELARRAIDVSDERSDLGALWIADAARRLIASGHMAEGEDILHRLRSAATASENWSVLVRLLGTLATLAAGRGEMPDSLMFNRQATAVAQERGLAWWTYDLGTALVLAYLGDLDEASTTTDRYLAADNPLIVEFAQLPACVVELERGELIEAWERLERLQGVYALGVPEWILGVLIARGRWYLLSGEAEHALETVAEARSVSGDLFDPSGIELLILAARAAVAVHDDAGLGDACRALDHLLELGGGRGVRAAATWSHGLAQARAGSFDDALALLGTGAEQFEQAGRLVHAAEAWADLAGVAEEHGDTATRDRALVRAFEIARGRRLRSVLTRLEAQQSRNTAGKAPDALRSLSPRELEIARLVVDGKTNREIASVLFVSEHTVRNQLVNIFGKLGISRRTELARLALVLEPRASDQPK